MAQEPLRAFETHHPAVLAAYAVAVTGTTMCALHPVFVAVSLAGALVCSLMLCGVARTLQTIRWQLPLLALVCLANPLFSPLGDTVLWQAGSFVLKLESLSFGFCMCMLLSSSLIWLWCVGQVLTLDRLLALGSGMLPTVGLMVSMAMRLVPQLVARGRKVMAVRTACSRAGSDPTSVRDGARLSGILLSWSLEDSVERSDAMRARGWSSGRKRTQYLPWTFSSHDVLSLGFVIALCVIDAFLEWVACSQWHFYPTMPHLVVWWGYVPHVILVALPSLVVLVDRVRWMRAGRASCKRN